MKESSHDRVNWIPDEALGGNSVEAYNEYMARLADKAEWEHFTPEFVGTKTQSVDVSRLNRQLTEAQDTFIEGRLAQKEGRVKFNTELPVTTFFVGDIHYGSIYTDHEKFEQDMAEISATPNAYIIFMSNLIDNAIPSQFPSNMLHNAIPPDKQVVAMRKVIQSLDEQGKVLGAVTSDCHEGWTAKHTGQDINALMYGYEGRNFPVLENGGRLHLEFPGADYNVGLYHKIGPFRSNFNYTHGLKQMNRLSQNGECDVIAGAHYHVGSTEEVYEGTGDHLRMNVYVQSGSYKGTGRIHDQWVVDKYGRSGQPGAQGVTFWANERRMMGNTNFETAIMAHESIFLREMAKK